MSPDGRGPISLFLGRVEQMVPVKVLYRLSYHLSAGGGARVSHSGMNASEKRKGQQLKSQTDR